MLTRTPLWMVAAPARIGGGPIRASRRAAGRLLAIGAVLVVALVGPADPGLAREGGGNCPPAQTDCHVWDGKGPVPGDPGSPGNPGGGDPGGGGGGGHTCTRNGTVVPCYVDVLGWFNQSDGCYYKLAEPQPPDLPEGKQAYARTCDAGGAGGTETVLLDAPPDGFGAPPNAADVAAELFASMTLERPRVGMAPGPGKPGLVGLPVWLWTGKPARQDKATSWGPQSKERTDRGLYVKLSAKVDYAEWNMGNGEKFRCNANKAKDEGQGVVHHNETGESPSCGYAGYPNSGRYPVSVTTHWSVTWAASNGQHGSIPNVTRTSATVNVTINELQVVTR